MQIVHLESPYKTLVGNDLAQQYFSGLIELRLKGFLKHLSNGVFPFSDDDFSADHLLIEHNGLLLAEFKAISVETCRNFAQDLPLLKTLRSSRQENSQYDQIKSYLKERSEKRIYYMGTFTEMVPDRRLRRLVRNLIALSAMKYFAYQNMDEIILTATRLSYKFLNQLGFEPMFEESVPQQNLKGELTTVMRLRSFSESALSLEEELNSYWEDRVFITSDKMGEQLEDQIHTASDYLRKTGS